MGKTKIIFKSFRYWECDDFASYLEEMALKGLILKKISSFFLVFEKCEPQEIFYQVEISPKGKEMDWGQSEDTLDYAQYCEAVGYEFVDSLGKCCVFRKNVKEVVHIFTEEERYQTLKKATLLQGLWAVLAFLIIWFVNSPMIPWANRWGSLMFFSYSWLVEVVFFFAVIFQGMQYFCAYQFVKKCFYNREEEKNAYYGYKRHSEPNKFPWSRVWEWATTVMIIMIVICLCFTNQLWGGLILLGFMLLISLGAQVIMAKIRPTGGYTLIAGVAIALGVSIIVYITLTMISSNEKIANSFILKQVEHVEIEKEEKLPLSLSEIEKECGSFDGAYMNKSISVWGSWSDYRTYYIKVNETVEEKQNEEYEGWENEDGEPLDVLYYRIYRTKYPWLQKLLWHDVVKSMNKEQYDYGILLGKPDIIDVTKEWEVDKAIQVSLKDENESIVNLSDYNFYFVQYRDKLVSISYEKEYTSEQIKIIKDKVLK